MLNRLFLDGKLKPFLVKTYRYGYILDKKLKKKIKMKEEQYPIYEKGMNYIENYKHQKGLTTRVMLYFDAINDSCYSTKAKNYLEKEYGGFDDELDKQKNNASYLWFLNDYDKSNLIEKQISLFQ